LSITVTIIERNPALSPLPPEVLIQNDENKVVDLPGDQLDLFREGEFWLGENETSETLRPSGGDWQGSRLSIHCKNDPRIEEWFEGHRLCELFFSDSDLSYRVTTGRSWLQHWPQVITAVEDAIARYREQCG
jgi:hypothetical protein